MDREITTHHVTDLPPGQYAEQRITAEPPDQFGVPHLYFVHDIKGYTGEVCNYAIEFQSGDPRKGWNGATSLGLLAIVRDFLERCQGSKFACDENLAAIGHIVAAMALLQERIRRRHAEGTFQTHQVATGETAQTSPEIQRRNRLDRMHPVERAITNAMYGVEGMPADARLTDAVNLLGKARDAVADYIDGVPRKEPAKERVEPLDQLTDKEIGDFQNQVRSILVEAVNREGGAGGSIDGAGCDSGFWPDFTLDEIGQGVSKLVEIITKTREQRDALARFKAFVHERIDAMGVPAKIEDHYLAEGCRIGGRLDYIHERLEALDGAKAECEKLQFRAHQAEGMLAQVEEAHSRGDIVGRSVQAATILRCVKKLAYADTENGETVGDEAKPNPFDASISFLIDSLRDVLTNRGYRGMVIGLSKGLPPRRELFTFHAGDLSGLSGAVRELLALEASKK